MVEMVEKDTTAGRERTPWGSALLALWLGLSTLGVGPVPSEPGAPDTVSQETATPRRESDVPEGFHAMSLDGETFEDLEFLIPILEDRRVVQLGESSHGIREYSLLKSRLVRFLHEKMGFDLLVFESSFYQCWDAGLDAAQAPSTDTLRNCLFGVWHTHEMVPLFDYLRATQVGPHPLHLAGLDIQPIGRNKEDRPEFFSRVVSPIDEAYGAKVKALDEHFLEVYARVGRERRNFFRSSDGEAMSTSYDDLVRFIDEHRDRLLQHFAASGQGEVPLVARQVAASMARYIRQQASPDNRAYVERRDEGMARNLLYLLEELYPEDKVIIWAHNFHVRHDNEAIPPVEGGFPDVPARTMGDWLKEALGSSLYTVGLYAFEGRAADNSRQLYDIEPAKTDSLEALFQKTDEPYLFVDLSDLSVSPSSLWSSEPRTVREMTNTLLRLVPRDQYDGILVVRSASPPEYLN